MRLYLTTILLVIASLFGATLNGAVASESPVRITYSLNDGWRFQHLYTSKAEVALVNLPHTWSDKEPIYSTASYVKQVHVPQTMRGKRLFIRFGGAMSVANLFVNGKFVGEHRGSYTAFTFEITDKVRFGEDNTIMVVVSNNIESDVLPVSTDHNLYGGIYRNVDLIVTNKNIISPTFYSSEGIFVEQREVTAERVEGVATLHLSMMDDATHNITLRFIAPDGYEVCRYTAKAGKAEKGSGLEIPFSIDYPELWSPERPTLYRVEATVGSLEKPTDQVVVNVGFRDIAIGKNNRLMVNGKEVEVHGVNMPHDREGVGIALSSEHMMSDLELVKDMGANALRSVVGPHSSQMYDALDREGILAWVDVPFARSGVLFGDICYYPTARFRENGFEQLREVIYQNYNHPSVVMWGIFSLLSSRGDDVVPYVKELNDLAHKLDTTRPTVACSNQDGEINFVTDLIVLRQDVGWYKGSYEDLRVWSRQLSENKKFKELRYAVCYGEDGSIYHVTDVVERAERNGRFRPERAQTMMHESYSRLIAESGIFWGVWLDNMFDYASLHRGEGMSYSGMVCFDHATKKDAYYLYRSQWNKSRETLHIAERRWKNRREEVQSIKVYSSVGRPTLLVDGQSVDLSEVTEYCWQADSVVIGERSVISVVDGTGRCSDAVELRVDKMIVSR